MKVSLYFRVQGLAQDEHGNPAPAGLKLSWDVKDGVEIPPYEVLAANVDKVSVLKTAFLYDRFREEDIEVITPEEYAREFDDEDNRKDV